MLTDWRGLHLAVCIFFHIFQHRFKWNHVRSEREEGREHRAAEETRAGSGDAWGVPWACLWNVFFHWGPTTKDLQNHYLQSANWCGKSLRPTGPHRPMAFHKKATWDGWNESSGAFAHHRDLRPHFHFKKPRCLATTEVRIKHPSLLTQHQGLPKGKVLLATSAHPLTVLSWHGAQGSSLSCEWVVPAFHVGWRPVVGVYRGKPARHSSSLAISAQHSPTGNNHSFPKSILVPVSCCLRH